MAAKPVTHPKESHMNRSSLTVSIAVAILSIAGTSLVVPEATAGSAPALPSQVVRYDDLNLAQPRGVAILYARIHAAAEMVCGQAQRIGSRLVSNAWKVCVAEAVDQAVAKVDRPALTAYHRARTGAPSLIRTAALAPPDARD
jgi:UrcA family protein